jgi:very-short-patch-repair endonuclease
MPVPNDHSKVLVTILNDIRALTRARDEHWYYIPWSSVQKWLRRWPPEWLAFYQTQIFGGEAFAVNYCCPVVGIRQVLRRDLFPEAPQHPRAKHPYVRVSLGPLENLQRPIRSARWRRITFIQTTWKKLRTADEINDLFDDSPLEDQLWFELKSRKLRAERQDFITAGGNDYALDFAFYCTGGKLDVETDGDTWHSDPKRIPEDNRRDNDLETSGWKLLRFNTAQINEQITDYCVPTILKNINKLGGLSEGRLIPRDITLDSSSPSQLSLFDDQKE